MGRVAAIQGSMKRPLRSVISKGVARRQEGKKQSKKGKKIRVHGKKVRYLTVTQTGDLPSEKRLKHGRVRKFDVLGKIDEDVLPRKTREMFRRMGTLKEGPGNLRNQNMQKNKVVPEKAPSPALGDGTDRQNSSIPSTGHLSVEDEPTNHQSGFTQEASLSIQNSTVGPQTDAKESGGKPVKLAGIQPGESINQFTARLRKERRQMMVDTVRKNSHQHEKKKAHYEKRQKRLERRKRKRKGQICDSDNDDNSGANQEYDADDWNEEEARLNQLPMYWQEIVRNNGNPVSEKKRKRMDRAEQQRAADSVAFGEQVERPPQITVTPKRRTKTTRISS